MSGLCEVGFGNDKFGKPLKLSIKESLPQLVFNVFTAKPGNFPSNPEIGLDIGSRILNIVDDQLEIEQLQQDAQQQLEETIGSGYLGEVTIAAESIQGQVVVVVRIPVLVDSSDQTTSSGDIVAGFSMDPKDRELMHTINYLSSNATNQ